MKILTFENHGCIKIESYGVIEKLYGKENIKLIERYKGLTWFRFTNKEAYNKAFNNDQTRNDRGGAADTRDTGKSIGGAFLLKT